MTSTSKSRPWGQRKGRTSDHNISNRHRGPCQTTRAAARLLTASRFQQVLPSLTRGRSQLRQREHDPPGPRWLQVPRSAARSGVGERGSRRPALMLRPGPARCGPDFPHRLGPARPCAGHRSAGPRERWAPLATGPAPPQQPRRTSARRGGGSGSG